MPTDPTQEAVQKGAKLLDEKVPGWADKINTELLEMRTYTHCVLGQLFQEYWTALDILEMGGGTAVSCGFNAHYSNDYQFLEEYWKQEITKRLSNNNPPAIS